LETDAQAQQVKENRDRIVEKIPRAPSRYFLVDEFHETLMVDYIFVSQSSAAFFFFDYTEIL
jgi:hypothetical protein